VSEPDGHLIELPDNVADMTEEELDALANRIYDQIVGSQPE
jgi:hypothetical protein